MILFGLAIYTAVFLMVLSCLYSFASGHGFRFTWRAVAVFVVVALLWPLAALAVLLCPIYEEIRR